MVTSPGLLFVDVNSEVMCVHGGTRSFYLRPRDNGDKGPATC